MRHQPQRRTHVFCARDLARNLIPHAHFQQGIATIAPCRHGIGIGHRQLAPGQRARQREPRHRPQMQMPARRADNHQRAKQERLARVGHDQPGLGQRVHPVFVGGHEQIGRAPSLDLPRQRRRGGKRQHRARVTMPGPGIGGGIHRFLQAGGGQHQRPARFGICGARTGQQSGKNPEKEQAHGAAKQGDRSHIRAYRAAWARRKARGCHCALMANVKRPTPDRDDPITMGIAE